MDRISALADGMIVRRANSPKMRRKTAPPGLKELPIYSAGLLVAVDG